MNLENIDLLSLQTGFMKNDITTQGFCAAFTPQLLLIANSISNCLIFSKIDDLSEGILDELAYELKVDWYDVGAEIEAKRETIKNSDKVHMYKGTPFSVEQVIRDYFGNGYIEEWFEYEGDPYHFRIIIDNPSAPVEVVEQCLRSIDIMKRKSTVIDEVVVVLGTDMSVCESIVIHTGDNYIIEQVV